MEAGSWEESAILNPLSSILVFSPPASAADAFVDETEAFHFGDVEQVPAVEKNGMGHFLARAFEVELFKLGPFSGNDQGVTAGGHVVHVIEVGDIFQDGPGFFHS